MIEKFVNEVYCMDARKLLGALPTGSLGPILADPMYGVTKNPKPSATYDWGPDPCRGDPDKWWKYHGPIYHESLRVLQPGGKLAWAMGCKFRDHFPEWFGGYRIWSFSRFVVGGLSAFGHIWIVQTREQEPVPFPDADSFIELRTSPRLLRCHPCPKAVEEMRFLVAHLSQPDDIIFDPFAGIGTTLVAAQQLGRRWIGCDLSRNYCRVALWRLREMKPLTGARQGLQTRRRGSGAGV